jgi:hypothetical protein
MYARLMSEGRHKLTMFHIFFLRFGCLLGEKLSCMLGERQAKRLLIRYLALRETSRVLARVIVTPRVQY